LFLSYQTWNLVSAFEAQLASGKFALNAATVSTVNRISQQYPRSAHFVLLCFFFLRSQSWRMSNATCPFRQFRLNPRCVASSRLGRMATWPDSQIPGFEILIKNCCPCVDGQQLRVAPPGGR
jgi:hypothetical protein